jgi:ribA/ribD-fused uncharacterized protein
VLITTKIYAENMSDISSVQPVYVKDRDLSECAATPMDICRAVIRVIHSSKLDGVQKVSNVWKIYPKDNEARLQLCVKQAIKVCGRDIKLYDDDPNASFQSGSMRGRTQSKKEKLTIKHLPFSVTNEEVARMLSEKNVVLSSPVKHGYLRDDLAEDQLTSFKSGDRFVYVEPFDPPLQKKQKVGDFNCIVLHHGKMWPCKACNHSGHKIGDDNCKAKPTKKIVSFKGYQHPLSNHFPCNINIFQQQFHSVEQAYLWRMALEFGKSDVAESILKSKHAGEAKKLSSSIAPNDERWKWEQENLQLMEQLLDAKAAQCPQFHQTLIEYHDCILADASPSLIWGTGLSPFVTEYTSPEYWPGQNSLGAMLMELTQTVLRQDPSSECSTTSDGRQNAELMDTVSSDVAVNHEIGYEVDNTVHSADSDHSADSNQSESSPLHTQSQPASGKPTGGITSPKRARPAKRTPRKLRATRSLSSTHVRNATPERSAKQLDIKTAFLGANGSKRKSFASSPDEKLNSQGKLQKSDSGVT